MNASHLICVMCGVECAQLLTFFSHVWSGTLYPVALLPSVWTLKTEEKPRFAVDTKAWMTESAKAFVKHIDNTFNGTVFRVGNAATIGAHASITPMVRK